jgi:hypothetical protein
MVSHLNLIFFSLGQPGATPLNRDG